MVSDVEGRSPGAGSRESPLRRLARVAARVVRWVVGGAARLGLFRPLAGALDLLDERLARRFRRRFGRRQRLLSWHREPDGRWRARLSCPDVVRTVERTASTRWRAITRSARALDRLPALRARLGRQPRRGFRRHDETT